VIGKEGIAAPILNVSKEAARTIAHREAMQSSARDCFAAASREKISARVTNFLAMHFQCAYVPVAQIRTCLWPCVDR
jgi:hypothetical protein